MKIDNKKPLTVDQLTVAKVVASRLGLEVQTVIEVIEMEQKTTMSYVKRGYRVTKKNYLTLAPIKKKGYTFESGLNGKQYEIPERRNIRVKIGDGFKNYVSSNSSMPNRICRFVNQK